ncbi:MAG: FAD-dependent thymidylate synthase [Flavobacteriales bacterium TMED191]|nr:MAG: FAD-dependent thymidylate synthase [Flavobacteriales bacterium TMED191]|tara:strand:- start:4808 stop:5512 length:705 start_codon:yes stop_codon:yes gene_type:complete
MRVELFEDGIGAVEYISHMGTDLSVVNAARVSFGSEKEEVDQKDVKLINYLMAHNHSSPFEHCAITFRFTVPLFIRSQHHRHRTWAYNEISRRYTSVDIEFYEPDMFRKQHKSNRQASTSDLIDPLLESNRDGSPTMASASGQIKTHHKECMRLFQALLESGVCREQARGVLPQNLYTQYYGTVNLHNLLKFVSLRVHEGAQWEIQQVAKACLKIVEQYFPHSVESYMKHKMEK